MDLEKVPTKPFDATDAHKRLQALAGEYRGTATTFLEPGKPGMEAPWEGRMAPILGGRFMRFEYVSSLFGDPFGGQLLLGFERDRSEFQFTWVDSFHTGTATLSSTGPAVPPSQPIKVRGGYYVKQTDETWGWRTEIHDDQAGLLRIRMYNVTPAGEEELGVEIALKRSKIFLDR